MIGERGVRVTVGSRRAVWVLTNSQCGWNIRAKATLNWFVEYFDTERLQMKVDLADFVRTGEFGRLKLGLTPREVIAIVGKPEDTSPVDTSPAIWKFGATELMFEHGKLISIEHQLTEKSTWPSMDITRDSASILNSLRLDAAHVALVIGAAVIRVLDKPSYSPETTTFIFENEVRLVFRYEQALTVSVLAASGPL